LVGAAYAAGELDRLEGWALGLGIREVIGFMDVSFGGGALKGDRLIEFFRSQWADRPIEALGLPFAAVATSLRTGAEVWLRSGSTLDAIRASIALPGVFAPLRREGSFLVDGGLVNPVPVSLARAMGADVVIAVDLASNLLGRRFRAASHVETPDDPAMPSLVDVLATCMDIVQVRIARSRLAGEPPDVTIAPRLSHLRLFDFHCAKQAIEEGHLAVERVARDLAALDERAA
jgi:NTE family protein